MIIWDCDGVLCKGKISNKMINNKLDVKEELKFIRNWIGKEPLEKINKEIFEEAVRIFENEKKQIEEVKDLVEFINFIRTEIEIDGKGLIGLRETKFLKARLMRGLNETTAKQKLNETEIEEDFKEVKGVLYSDSFEPLIAMKAKEFTNIKLGKATPTYILKNGIEKVWQGEKRFVLSGKVNYNWLKNDEIIRRITKEDIVIDDNKIDLLKKVKELGARAILYNNGKNKKNKEKIKIAEELNIEVKNKEEIIELVGEHYGDNK